MSNKLSSSGHVHLQPLAQPQTTSGGGTMKTQTQQQNSVTNDMAIWTFFVEKLAKILT